MKKSFFSKIIRIRLIQILLNFQLNIKQIFFVLVLLNILLITTLFGFWLLIANSLKIVCYFLIIAAIIIYFIINKINFISKNNTIIWIEEKNSLNRNPLLAVLDKPANMNFNNSLWSLHKSKSFLNLKQISFKSPRISFDKADPLKLRFILILVLVISFIFAIENNKLRQNLNSFYSFKHQEPKEIFKLKVTAWMAPPKYTGLMQKTINLKDLSSYERNDIIVPDGTNLFMHIYSPESKFKIIEGNKEISFEQEIENNYKINYSIRRNQSFEIYYKDKLLRTLKFSVKKDTRPEVKFLSNPETVNNLSMKFTSIAKDDYGIKNIKVFIAKPKKFQHFLEKGIIFDLDLKEIPNKKEVINHFYKLLADHIWAGSLSNIQLIATDDIGQKSTINFELKLPQMIFKNEIAKKLLGYRNDIAQQKVKTKVIAKKINLLLTNQPSLIKNSIINKQANLVLTNLNKEKKAPRVASHTLYKNMWKLSIMIEEGQFYNARKNLDQVKQNLLDSIDKKNVEDVSTNIEEMKNSLNNFLQMGKNQLDFKNTVNKNLTNQLEKISQEIKDLLKTGSKERVDERIQKLKQLSESLKNPNNFDDEEILKQENKKNIINKLSELLNEQERVMEESFNMAANRGKFKQSSSGSGGKSPKEKQENLRNSLGNIMREIGASENEIPQELGRADRAMRQASRDLENGSPDRASNAQGRALEMIQRAMNRFSQRDPKSYAEYKRSGETDPYKSSNDKQLEGEINTEFSGTSTGGSLQIPDIGKIRKSKAIANELYSRYNDKNRKLDEREYIKNLLNWY